MVAYGEEGKEGHPVLGLLARRVLLASWLLAAKSLRTPRRCVHVSVLSWEGKAEMLPSVLGQGWKSSWSELPRGYRIKMSLLLHKVRVHREKRLLEKKLLRFLLIHHTLWLLVFRFQNLFLIIYDMDFFNYEMKMAYPLTLITAVLVFFLLYLMVSCIQYLICHSLCFSFLLACGGIFHMAEGIFNSPGYPEIYPSNVECVWNIVSSPGNQLQLSFM